MVTKGELTAAVHSTKRAFKERVQTRSETTQSLPSSTTTMDIVGGTPDYQIWLVTMNHRHFKEKTSTEIELGGLLIKSYNQNFIPAILSRNFPNSKSMAVVIGSSENNLVGYHGVHEGDVLCIPIMINKGIKRWNWRLGLISEINKFRNGDSLVFYVARAKEKIHQHIEFGGNETCEDTKEDCLTESNSSTYRKRTNQASSEDQPQAKRQGKLYDNDKDRDTKVVTPSLGEKPQTQKSQSSDGHEKATLPAMVSTSPSVVSTAASPLKNPSPQTKQVATTTPSQAYATTQEVTVAKSIKLNASKIDKRADRTTMAPADSTNVDISAKKSVHSKIVRKNDMPSNGSSFSVCVEDTALTSSLGRSQPQQEQTHHTDSITASHDDMLTEFSWYKEYHKNRIELINDNKELYSNYKNLCSDIASKRNYMRQWKDWLYQSPRKPKSGNDNTVNVYKDSTPPEEFKQFSNIMMPVDTSSSSCPYRCLAMYSTYLGQLKKQNQELNIAINALKLELYDLQQKCASYESRLEEMKKL